MTAEEEIKIISDVLGGDINAFENLVMENQKNVYNLALKMTGSEEDAQDISQDAFIRAYRRLGSFRGDSRFSVWLYRLTYNLCVDFLRKRPRDKVISLTYEDEGEESHDLEIPDMRNLPEDSLIRRELRETIAKSINELSPPHKEILVLREITEMSYGDISETLRISEGTVKSRLARARLNLATILIDKGTFPESLRHMWQEEVE